MSQLVRVIQWCWDHSIRLDELDLPRHLVKFRAAVAYLINIIKSKDLSHDDKFGQVRQTIQRIQQDHSRAETRLWAQAHTEGQEPLGPDHELDKAKVERQRMEDGSRQ